MAAAAQCAAPLQGTVLRIFLSAVERCLREHSPACPATETALNAAPIQGKCDFLRQELQFNEAWRRAENLAR